MSKSNCIPSTSIRLTLHDYIGRLVNFDLWILLKIRRSIKFSIRVFGSVMQLVSIVALCAAILLMYTLAHVKIDIPIYETEQCCKASLPPKNGLTQQSDDSIAVDASILKHKLAKLKMLAYNLQTSLEQMQSRCNDMTKYSDTPDTNTKLPDFASEAAGGVVLDTPDTESYYEAANGQATLFGYPIWAANYFTPRKVIQPWTEPGECWAFKGFRGKILIKLAYVTVIDQITIEHIPVAISITGSIDSAPRDFVLHGSMEKSFLVLDKFTYDVNGPPSQTFRLMNMTTKEYPIHTVLLEIRSNWGNPKYTCIYRFRVHGKIANVDNEKRDKINK